MNQELLSRLEKITEEEAEILAGKESVEKSRYTDQRFFTIDSKKLMEEGRLITARTHTRFVHFPVHTHNYIEVMYCCQGSIRHIIEGKEVCLTAGDLLFLNPHTRHEILPAGIKDIGVNFIVLPQFFDVAYSMTGKDNILGRFLANMLKQDDAYGQYLYFKVGDVLQIQNLIENMIYSLVNHEKNQDVINQTTMGLIFLHLLNATEHMVAGNENEYENMAMMTVFRYLDDHYRDASLTELCRMLKIPMPALSRMIKQKTGFTFKEHLQRKRLNKTAELICDTTIPVNDIAVSVGYENTSYFHRIFREKYHMTPKEYRKKNQDAGQIYLSSQPVRKEERKQKV